MPARKSDARRSDVSVARFVLADDDDDDMATEPTAAEVAEPAAPASAPPAPTSQASPQERRDKEKEKEKERERERERERDAITIEDLTLPKSIITRLAKGVLPPNTQIQANAILALSKSATVFISHLASNANEFTLSSNKKTIMPADVFKALDEIEYGFMRERLEAEFAKFNEVQTSKRSTYRKKVAALKKKPGARDGPSGVGDASMISTGSHDADDADQSLQRASSADGSVSQSRAAKKARIGGRGDSTRMELDEHEPSDAETVPEDLEEEEEDQEEEEEEEEEEEDDEDDEPEGADDDADDAEDRAAPNEDEALDDDDESE
ncbi:histone-fold-containing protein [Lasiosphaeris hirsuta]|uniref:DNA polymerase epsilon subunit D n=1 Tax=Lasiosphaeris hirsuta TaxID=260670 RepID=A0AA40BA10_9PEZI|nr:histone-fold-containing protein [Lasiosphaeris hirsuta]